MLEATAAGQLQKYFVQYSAALSLVFPTQKCNLMHCMRDGRYSHYALTCTAWAQSLTPYTHATPQKLFQILSSSSTELLILPIIAHLPIAILSQPRAVLRNHISQLPSGISQDLPLETSGNRKRAIAKDIRRKRADVGQPQGSVDEALSALHSGVDGYLADLTLRQTGLLHLCLEGFQL